MSGIDLEASRRLVEAFERIGEQTPGAGAGATRSPVPREVADAFRAMVEGAPEGPDAAASASQSAESSLRPNETQGVEGVRPADAESLRTDGVASVDNAAASGVEPLREAQVLSPSELYRLQFQVNLHMMDVKALSAIRNRSASDLEAQLRSAS
ncbi:MAG TPA: hypothetical protein IAA02_05675 [Candidatus Sutterella merdavium]|nr:hypothetical protein [Candidatus Sutterella merdavium]